MEPLIRFRLILGRRHAAGCALLLTLAALSIPSICAAQDYHAFTADFGGGATWRDGASLRGFNVGGNAGLALTPKPDRYNDTGTPRSPRPWSVYLTANFLFSQSALSQKAVDQAIVLNPQNPALLSAASGTVKSYSGTVDPTLRYRIGSSRVTVYGLAGFGVMHRSIDFTGVPSQGILLQPPSAVVTGIGGSSGVFDSGIGISFGPVAPVAHLTFYVEQRRLQAFGPNSGTTLWPISVGIRW